MGVMDTAEVEFGQPTFFKLKALGSGVAASILDSWWQQSVLSTVRGVNSDSS
jgi:hypothetical protein